MEALTLDGQQLNMWTFVEQNGTIIQNGFTPMTVEVSLGTTYSITVSDYQNFIFDHWEDGSTQRTRVITPSESSTITAYYAS